MSLLAMLLPGVAAAQPVLNFNPPVSTSMDSVVAGDSSDLIEFGITITNTGGVAAAGVEIDVLQPALVFSSGTGDFSGCIAMPCSLGTIAATTGSESGSLFFSVDASTAAGTISTQFTATSTTPGAISATSVAVDNTVTTEADLSITQTSITPATAVPGGTDLTYNFEVENLGFSDATSVVVTNPALTGVTVTFSGTGCTGTPAAGDDCTIGTLASGATATLTATVDVPGDYHLDPMNPDPILMVVTVSSATTDPDSGNNSSNGANETTSVVPTANLSINPYGNSVSTVVPGEPLTYSMTVQNAGPSSIDRMTVSNLAPDNLLSQVFEASEGFYNAADDGWVDILLAAGDDATLTVSGFLDPGINPADNPTLSNTVSADLPSGYTGNGATADDDDDTVDGVADLSVVKDNGIDGVAPNQQVFYDITVFNDGPSDAFGVVLSDSFPATISSATWTCSAPDVLTALDLETDGFDGFDGLQGAAGVAVSPDGAHVYVTGSSENKLAVLARDVTSESPPSSTELTGELSFVEVQTDGNGLVDGLQGARGVVVSPDGAHVYVAGTGEDELAVFSRNSGTGALTFVEVQQDDMSGVDGLQGVESLAISPDGRHVYATGTEEDELAVFERDSSTGMLSFVEIQQDGSGLVDGLAGARGVAISPDGAHVYVTGSDDNALAVFERDPSTGMLTFVEVQVRGASPDGLGGAAGVVVSPDGAHVYVTGATDSGIATFGRDAATGALTFVQVLLESFADVEGLLGAAAVTIAPDGRHVFVSGFDSDEVAVFERFSATGSLDWLEVETLSGAAGLVVSPDGRNLYAAANTGNALAIFSEVDGARCPSPDSGSGDISAVIDVPAQGSLSFSVTAIVASNAASNTDCAGAPCVINTAFIFEGDYDEDGDANADTDHASGVCPFNSPPNTAESNNDQCTDVDLIGVETNVTITKDDGGAIAVPGETLTYTVTVTNAGPANLTGAEAATVTDLLDDPAIASASWTCQGSGGGVCGNASGSGAISEEVELPAAGSVTFTIIAEIDPAATGTSVGNTAEVELPVGFSNTGVASATVDTDIERQADLRITKENVTVGDVGAGEALDYLLTVENCGPSRVTGALVIDNFPVEYLGPPPADPLPAWTCTPDPGCASCSCGTLSGTGNLSITVDLDAGDPSDCSSAGAVTISVSGRVADAAPAVLSNRATVSPPADVTDPLFGNNSDTEIVVLEAEVELSIIKDDGQDTAVPGEEIVYSITVQNDGPNDVELATVTDFFDVRLEQVSWTCSSESPALGTLTLFSEDFDGAGDPTVDGAAGAAAVVVSADGAHVYVAGPDDAAIALFDRNATTGEVEFDSIVEDGVSGVTGLTGVAGLAISPDGTNLYAVSPASGSLVVFQRNTSTGALSFVQVLLDDQGGIDGLGGASSVAVSPDGENVYVAAVDDDSVATFDRNTASAGELTQGVGAVIFDVDAGVDGLDGARAVVVSPDGAQVYVASEVDDAVVTLNRDDGDGSLTWDDAIFDTDAGVDGLDGARGLAISPDGTSLYAAGADDNAVAVLRRATATGELTWIAVRIDGGTDGTDGIDDVTSVAVSADGEHLYATGAGTSEAVAVFRRNTATGALTWIERRANGDSGAGGTPVGLAGASAVAVTPDDAHVLVAAEDVGSLTVFERAGAPPAFGFAGGAAGADPVAPVTESDTDIDGLSGARSLALSGENVPLHLYAAGFGDNAVAAFSRDADSGELTLVGVHKAGACDELAEAPSGPCVANVPGLDGAVSVVTYDNNVYVAAQSITTPQDNAVTAFDRDSVTGELSFLQILRQGDVEGDGDEVDGLSGAAALALDPFGVHLYAVSEFQGAVTIFSRSGTGELDFVDLVDDLDGLAGADGLALSPDGEHLYVAAGVDDSVVVFERDSATGLLTAVQVLQDEDSSSPIGTATKVPGLDRATSVAVSDDGQNVYVSGRTDDSVVVFSRDTDNSSTNFGLLTWVETHVDGEDGIDGLDGARAVKVSPDGKNVYVAGEDDDALAVFARESLTGTLTFVEARIDGEDGVEGLSGAFALAVIPSSVQVYVASVIDEAIALFTRASGSRCTGSGVGDIDDTVDIAAGGQVVYTVTATIDPAATGELANLAEVAAPDAVTDLGDDHPDGVCEGNSADPDIGRANDACRDVDTLVPTADLAIDKTDGTDRVVPGEEHTYTISVTNDGPSNAVGVLVEDVLTDVFPDGAVWSCVAVPSGSLTFLQSVADGDVQDGPVTVDGLDGASGVAVSPDGEHVYATGLADQSLTIFDVDIDTGELTFVGELREGTGIDGLAGASAVTVSPDGDHVYVVSQVSDTLLVFSRDTSAGTLTFVETFQDLGTAMPIAGATLVDGLDQPVAVALDGDGDNVYVAAANSDSVAVFARADMASGNYGELTWLEILQNGVGSVVGLAGASSVAVSSDGATVYATGANDGAVVAFSRDGSGMLSFLEFKTDGSGITGLAGASSVAVSSDDANVYVAGADANSVVVFSRAANGTVTYQQTLVDGVDGVNGLAGASDLVVSPDGFHVYVAGSDDDALAVLRRRTEDLGQLTFVENQFDGLGSVSGLAGAVAVAIAPSGRYVLAAGRAGDALVVFERPIDSSCSSGSSIPAVAGDPVILSDLADVAAGSEVVYEVTGTIASDACPPPYPCTSTDFVNRATVSIPSGVDLIDTDSSNDEDEDSNTLSARADLVITKQDGFIVHQGLLDPNGVAVDPTGANLYVTGFTSDGVAVFARDDSTGVLDFLEAELEGVDAADGLNGAAGVAVSPDGEHVYVAGSLDNAVAVFTRDTSTGKLAFVEQQSQGFGGVDGLLGAVAVAISTDGAYVYVAGTASAAIAIFSRDTDDTSDDFGKLTFVETVTDGDVQGELTVDGLTGVRGLALSPDVDNPHLYAAGFDDNAVAVFTRDADSGSLTFVEVVIDGDFQDPLTVTGLEGAMSVALDPAGEHLYVAAADAGAVAVFARETDDSSDDYGKLTFVEAQVDGDSGVDGLGGAYSVIVTPDPTGADAGGQHVYVAGSTDNAVAVFSRDVVTGALTFVGTVIDGDGGVEGLAGARGLVIDPEGLHAYAAGFDDDAVAAFSRDWDSGTETGTGALAFVESQAEGGGGVAPGADLTYEIVVTNLGPSDVQQVLVTDIFPGALTDVEYTCSFTAGASCFDGTGDLIQEVELAAGSSVTFLASGKIQPGFTGTITNTVTVTEPDGVIELNPDDNTAVDDDTVTALQADLGIDKISCSDLNDCDNTQVTTVTPGDQVNYQVTARNDGPSDARGVTVTDIFPETLTDVSWTCRALPVPGLLIAQGVSTDGDAVDPISQDCSVFNPALTEIDGLDGAIDLAVSPDGLHIYVAGAVDNALAVFRRDLRTGVVSFVDVVIDGEVIRDPDDCGTILGTVDGLEGVATVIVSPDGAHVYAGSENDDAITFFSRDTSSGELTFVGFVRDGVAGVNGIGDVSALAISDGGEHLYAAGTADDAVAVFSRDSSTGVLTFVEFVADSIGGVDGLTAVADVALSPDGSHLYAAGSGEDALAIFSRDAATGALTFVDTVTGSGLTGVAALVVSDDGSHVYAAGDSELAVFSRDVDSLGSSFGLLTSVEVEEQGVDSVDGLVTVTDLFLSADGENLYAAGSGADAVAVFRRDTASGEIEFLETFDGLAGVSAVLASPDDDHAYVTTPDDDALVHLDRQSGSRCTESGSSHIIDSVDLVSGGTVTYLISATLNSNVGGTVTNVATVEAPDSVLDPGPSLNSASNDLTVESQVALTLTKDDGQTDVVPGEDTTYTLTIANAGPSDLVGGVLTDILPAELTDGSWTCDAVGSSSFVEVLTHGVDVDGLDEAGSVAVSPDTDATGPLTGGDHVYVTARASDTVVAFARDAGDSGRLTLIATYADGAEVDDEVQIDGLDGASSVAISPDGLHVYVTGAEDDSLAIFSRDATTGELTYVGVELETDVDNDGLEGAASVAISGDGAHVYVASEEDDAVVVFARDVATGELTFVEREKDGFGGLELGVIDGAFAVAVSPDGAHVIVASRLAGTLAVFSRDTTTGEITFVEVYTDGSTEVPDGLSLVNSLSFSPGGLFVYAASLADDMVTVFSRDLSTGELTLVQVLEDGVDGVDGLDGARAVALTPDGQALYAVSSVDGAVAIFQRDGVTGELTFAGLQRDGVASVDGLAGARALAVSPDAQSVYVTGADDDAVAVFVSGASASCVASGSGTSLVDSVSVAAGGTVSYLLTATVASSATGSVTNTFCVDTSPAINSGDDCASDTNNSTPTADLALSKDDNTDTVLAGGVTTYTLTVVNLGPSDAPGAVVTDTFPAEIISVDWSCTSVDATCQAPAGGSGDISATVDLPAGSTAIFTAVATIDPTATGDITNVASVAPPGSVPDPDLGNNMDDDVDQVLMVADLGITKTADPAIVGSGQPLTFTLSVVNSGPGLAASAVVTDTLPAGTGFTGFDGGGFWLCGEAAGIVTCTAPTLGVGPQPDIVLFTTAPTAAGVYTNTATIAAAGTDSNSGNDLATADFEVDASAPTVTLVNSDADTGDGELSEMETALAAIDSLLVTFSEAMDATAISDPASYQLLAAGADGVFATAACGALAGDDETIAVDTASWDAGTSTVTVGVNGGADLLEALYRWAVCPTAVDAAGNALDGDGNGTGGDAFLRYFRVRSDNLLERPWFDFATDLDVWTTSSPVPGEVVYDATEDADGFPLSGSVQIADLVSGGLRSIAQCIELPADRLFTMSGAARLSSVSGDISALAIAEYYTDDQCLTAPLGSASTAPVLGDTGGAWTTFGTQFEVASEAMSTQVFFIISTPSMDGFDASLDRLELRAADVIFADGFESGDLSAWSGSVP